MTVLNILTFPDPRLRKVAAPVIKFDKSLKKLTEDMLETMYQGNGIGLAATQVNVHKRVIVIDVSDDRTDPKIFINPEFEIKDNKSLFSFSEGCLSIPGYNEEITRPDKILLKWQDVNGKFHEEEPEGILTVCIQHEIDHLEGKLMVDYMSSLKRERIRSNLRI